LGRVSAYSLDKIAVELGMDKESVLKASSEFQALGMITLANDFSASVNPPDLKGMQEAYEVRAALEEIAGRAAAATLGGASLLLPPRNSAKGGWPGSESQT
jgi:DNA-binding GntR family transcriptional regulator